MVLQGWKQGVQSCFLAVELPSGFNVRIGAAFPWVAEPLRSNPQDALSLVPIYSRSDDFGAVAEN